MNDSKIVFESLDELLRWITGTSGGAFLIVAWFISWAVEGTTFWGKLTSQMKSMIMVLAAGIFGGLAYHLSVHQELVSVIDPYVRPLMYAATLWLVNQLAHGKNPLKKE